MQRDTSINYYGEQQFIILIQGGGGSLQYMNCISQKSLLHEI